MARKQGTEARRIASIETRAPGAVKGTVPAQHLESTPPSSDGHRQATRSAAGDLLNLVEELAGIERIGVTPLARLLGIPVATTYRMLRLLERTGYVEQLKRSKEYRLTLKLFELGCEVASKTTIRDVATVEIERLAEQTGMTTNLGVLVGHDVLYLSKIDTDDLLTLNLPPGSRAPATCTAMGKAMLAFDPRPVESIVGEGPYLGRTDYSIRTLDALEEGARRDSADGLRRRQAGAGSRSLVRCRSDPRASRLPGRCHQRLRLPSRDGRSGEQAARRDCGRFCQPDLQSNRRSRPDG